MIVRNPYDVVPFQPLPTRVSEPAALKSQEQNFVLDREDVIYGHDAAGRRVVTMSEDLYNEILKF